METYWQKKDAGCFNCPTGYTVTWDTEDPLDIMPLIFWNNTDIGMNGLFERLYLGDEAAGELLQHLIATGYAKWPDSKKACYIADYDMLKSNIVTLVLGNIINELYMDDSKSGDEAMRGDTEPYINHEKLQYDFLKALWKMSGKAVGYLKNGGISGMIYTISKDQDGNNRVLMRDKKKKKQVEEFNLLHSEQQTSIDEEMIKQQEFGKKFKMLYPIIAKLNEKYLLNTRVNVIKNTIPKMEKSYDIRIIQLYKQQDRYSKAHKKWRQLETEIEELKLEKQNMCVLPYDVEDMAEILFHSFRRGLRSRKNKVWYYLSPLHLEGRILIFILHDIAQYKAEEIPEIMEQLGYLSTRGTPFSYNSISSSAATVRKLILKCLEKTKN